MARAGSIHPAYTAVARCVGRQLRMPCVLSGLDEGGICADTFSGPRGRRTRHEQMARCAAEQCRNVDSENVILHVGFRGIVARKNSFDSPLLSGNVNEGSCHL